jgi:hypothetical protein
MKNLVSRLAGMVCMPALGAALCAGVATNKRTPLLPEVRTGTPDAPRMFIDGQIDTWARVVKDNGSKAEWAPG